MRLEDSFIYFMIDVSTAEPSRIVSACEAAIGASADIVQLRGLGDTHRDLVAEVSAVCRRDDALFIVAEDAALASEAGADGVHLESRDAGIGIARAVLGEDRLVGMSSNDANEAQLAIEVGADYLLHGGGREGVGALSGIGAGAGVPFFLRGLKSVDEAKDVTERGVYRICLEAEELSAGDDVGEQVASYARLLGRCI